MGWNVLFYIMQIKKHCNPFLSPRLSQCITSIVELSVRLSRNDDVGERGVDSFTVSVEWMMFI